jgi:pimeloyl-ACP methyl ester carboxylesterase
MSRTHGLMRVSRCGLLMLPATIAIGCSHSTSATSQVNAPQLTACGVDSGHTKAGLYFECHGAGDDVVFLIPAFSMDRRMWTAQVPMLARSARVIAYDLRGHGRSIATMEPYSSVDDLVALMDELSVSRAHLIGLSNGARIALDFALTHPARARSLVLASPGVSGYTGGDFSYMTPVITAVRAGDLARAAELWAGTPLMHIPNDSAAAALIRMISSDNRSIWGHRSNPERPLSPPAIGRLHEVKVPVLVITGDRDLPALRQLADTVAQTIPGASRVIIPDAGHMVNVAAPEAFNRAVLSFLRAKLARH